MIIQIYPDLCIACGLCQVYGGDIFDYNEDGIVLFTEKPESTSCEFSTDKLAELKIICKKCPVHAIRIEKP